MHSKWRLFALLCAFIASANSNAQLTPSQQEQTQPSLKRVKIGLAPHERQACKLPMGSSGTRRLNANPAASSAPPQQQVSASPSGPLDGQPELGAPTITITAKPPASKASNSTRRTSDIFAASSTEQESGAEHQLGVPNTRPSPSRNGESLRKRTQVDTSERLRQLRQLLLSNNYDGYLVGPQDEHGSEYVSEFDRRLHFISGFSGSNGYALVLRDRAVLFTDGRYELQADADLDCNWWLVVGQEQLADIVSWLASQNALNLRIGADARLMSLAAFDYLDDQFRTKLNSEIALISSDLVDVVWDSHQILGDPQPLRHRSQAPLQVFPLDFAGNLSWQEKLARVVELMQQQHKARHYVVSRLDDIAWLLNLRGADIPMSPLFKAYVFISLLPAMEKPAPNSVEQLLSAIELQQKLQQKPFPSTAPAGGANLAPSQLVKLVLYIDPQKVTPEVRAHLGSNNDSLLSLGQMRIQLEYKNYDLFVADFREKFTPSSVHESASASSAPRLQGKLLLDSLANVAIHVLAKNYPDRLVLVEPLIQRLKAVKSNSEVQGMRMAHQRDSLAICMLLSELDRDLGSSRAELPAVQWTEISAAKRLEYFRSLMDHNRGQSFDTISAYGSNGAIVHYKPNENDDESQHRVISNDSTFLLDSGGQYLDGTTDITRTLHFGQPTDWQRETYTRVLMGAIDMMSLVFPGGEQMGPGKRLNDLLARRHLMELGLDYGHGTGHGIGAYSMVHEAPALIEHFAASSQGACSRALKASGSGAAQVHSEPLALMANMFSSVEPGYYEAGEFGIRLENIVVTQAFHSPLVNNNGNASATIGIKTNLLRFEPISLVPFEPKLIKFNLLSNKQKAWLNSYNLMVRMRLTQQVNYYLSRSRDLQKREQQVAGAQQASDSANSTLAAPPNGAAKPENFARMEQQKFQELLEQAHSWILKKTELIQLDAPQRKLLVSPPRPSQPDGGGRFEGSASRLETTAASINSNKGATDLWRQLGTDPDGQHLILAYMAQLPFGDREASQAAVSLLAGRSDLATPTSGQLAEKCTGIECDLLLLEALNAHQQATRASGGQKQRWDRQSGEQGGQQSAVLAADETEAQDASSWDRWRQHLMDLFQLSGAASSPSSDAATGAHNWAAAALGHMWPLLCFGALLVLALQVALMLYVCNGSSSSSPSSARASPGSRSRTAPPPQQQQRLQTAATSGRWHSSASGRRIAQLGDTLASFRLIGARQANATSAQAPPADRPTEML